MFSSIQLANKPGSPTVQLTINVMTIQILLIVPRAAALLLLMKAYTHGPRVMSWAVEMVNGQQINSAYLQTQLAARMINSNSCKKTTTITAVMKDLME